MKLQNIKSPTQLPLVMLIVLFMFTITTNNVNAMGGGVVIYVDADAANGGDGTAWGSAFNKLQDALAVATNGDSIWVADGIYYPDQGSGQSNNDVNSTFDINTGIQVYGGFNGTESNAIDRDPVNNLTVLSGDIDADNGNPDVVDGNGISPSYTDLLGNNAYHVVTFNSANNSTVLSGFAITGGMATGSSNDNQGAAIYCGGGSPNLSHLLIQSNLAGRRAAALWDCNSSVSDSIFIENSASNTGGVAQFVGDATFNDFLFMSNRAGSGSVIYKDIGSLTVNRSTFIANYGTNSEGVVRLKDGMMDMENVLMSGNAGFAISFVASVTGSSLSANLINVTLTGNKHPTGSVGGILFTASNLATLDVDNSIIWKNEDSSGAATLNSGINNAGAGSITVTNSIVQGAFSGGSWVPSDITDGGNNSDEDPLLSLDVDTSLIPTAAGNAHLSFLSPAINAGNNTVSNQSVDLDGNTRIVDGVIDMGPYEAPLFVETDLSISKTDGANEVGIGGQVI